MKCFHSNTSGLYQFNNYEIIKCHDCSLVLSKSKQKIPAKELYKNYYHNEIGGRFFFGLEYIIKLFRLFRAFKIHGLVPHAKSILDIGSGRGFMLYFLKKYYGFTEAIGTQISKPAVDFSRKKLGLQIYDQDLLKINFKEKKFDLVTMWHVLEHVYEPEEYIKRIGTILKQDGTLIIEVPNFNSWTRSLTRQYWLSFDLKHHLTFFTESSLTALLRQHNFKILKTHTFSLEYSTYTSAQSLLSYLTRSDQVLFNSIQSPKLSLQAIYHFSIILLLIFPCFIINILLYFSKSGEVLLVIAKKQ